MPLCAAFVSDDGSNCRDCIVKRLGVAHIGENGLRPAVHKISSTDNTVFRYLRCSKAEQFNPKCKVELISNTAYPYLVQNAQGFCSYS